ncbi:MAG: glycosyltransferase, partial [Bdellovibrionota bacterium]
MSARRKILIIGYVWPEPTSSAAGVRDWDLIRIFKSAGWEIIFASQSKENEFSARIQNEGVRTVPIAANDPAFDRFVCELQPDYVVFDRFVSEEQFGWRVEENCPNAVRIVDTQDLHFLRRARQLAHEKGAPLSLETSEDALREIASIYRSDTSWILSTFELALLTETFRVPGELLHYLPFAYGEIPEPKTFQEREGYAVIGNFRHPPNLDGVLWLRNSIWPLIRARDPSAVVHVYGAYPPREASALHSPQEGFHVLGPAKDQYETLARYRVNLAPLRFGAGIKGKISDGWFSGTPVVSTPVGAEGMEEPERFGGLIAQNETQFADFAIQLARDEALWRKLSQAGRETLRTRMSFARLAPALITDLEAVRALLAARRARNFVGKMLWHQTLRST